jgi:transaldolase
MRIFADSANLQELDACLARGVIAGITTNPSILSKEPKTDFVEHIRKIVALCRKHNQLLPLSVEVFTRSASEMVNQAEELVRRIEYENIYIKVPIGWDELEVIHQLVGRGIRVNCTCLFTEAQCMLAANAGASYVSIFLARLKDIGGDPLPVIANTRKLLDMSGNKAEIIVGSIRHERDIMDAQLAGAHIVTAGPPLFAKMTVHPQTTKSVEGFLTDFEKWLK